jgi:tRNA (guanine37-N1)-methyltransferase
MRIHIITIFPNIFDSYFNESILKRAQKNGLIEIKIHNLRDWTVDRHKTVDDTPYGGGAGMVMKIEPIAKVLQTLKSEIRNPKSETNPKSKIQNPKSKIILLSAKGKTWTQQLAKKYSKLDEVILICGRYEGVDERVLKFVDEEISIGDYVLTGGEIPAMAIVDSITRLLPGALGNAESSKFESHTTPGTLEYPQYTRPEVFQVYPVKSPHTRGAAKPQFNRVKKLKVPKVLLSGNHAEIEKWRRKHSKKL